MKLVPFSTEHLGLNEPLPFGLRDAAGRLLLSAGQLIDNGAQLAELQRGTLFSEESESAEWHRRLAAAIDQAVRSGMSLGGLAGVRPHPAGQREAAPQQLSLAEQWHGLVMALDVTLRDVRAGSDWRSRLFQVHLRTRQLYQRRPDASLYTLVYEAGNSTQKYSCNHALLAMLVCEQAAAALDWPQPWIDSLGRAALGMNVAMLRLQDLLASTDQRLSPEMRVEIGDHAEAGACQLHAGGLGDPLAVAAVRQHHDAGANAAPLSSLPLDAQLARLLRRVDIFTAKLSRRATRAPMSPVQAARDACLGSNGVPDDIGGALLKAVGLYPPGSFVELTCGELGIVVARGHMANRPYVASLVSPAGNPLGMPALRETADGRFAVKGAVAPSVVKVRPPHERLLALR